MCLLFSARDETQQSAHCSHTLNNVFACVCFRSAVCFAKQHVFFHVWVVHVGRQATHRVQPSPFHVGMFSTFLLFVLSFVFLKEKKGARHSATKGARHEVLRGATNLVRTSFFFSVSVIDRRCPRMFGTRRRRHVGRRTAVDINVYEELRDVRCGIAFFCVHTSILRCKATIGWDNRGRSTCCFHRLPERHLLVFFAY